MFIFKLFAFGSRLRLSVSNCFLWSCFILQTPIFFLSQLSFFRLWWQIFFSRRLYLNVKIKLGSARPNCYFISFCLCQLNLCTVLAVYCYLSLLLMYCSWCIHVLLTRVTNRVKSESVIQWVLLWTITNRVRAHTHTNTYVWLFGSAVRSMLTHFKRYRTKWNETKQTEIFSCV